ncbi:MAG TPA: hypothetical protein P5114_06200 [Hyphomicrobiaceae bacterium]|nr:hypothetical protein [Hyphomicrobiaceae bacterium]
MTNKTNQSQTAPEALQDFDDPPAPKATQQVSTAKAMMVIAGFGTLLGLLILIEVLSK